MSNLSKTYFFLCTVFLLTTPLQVNAGENVNTAIDARINALQERFNIPIFYKGDEKQQPLHYEFLPAKQYPILNRYLQLFEEELLKYPPDFFTKKKIRGIALVRRLFRGETPMEGAYSSTLRVMLFDVLRSAKNKAIQKQSIHHEMFHMMSTQLPGYEDLEAANWAVLNVTGFSYGKHNLSRKEPNPVNMFAPYQLGFVTHYSMISPAEDQAEIFATLMQSKQHRLIQQWQEKDTYLRRKVRAIKTFVAAYDPEMDETYWQNLNR